MIEYDYIISLFLVVFILYLYFYVRFIYVPAPHTSDRLCNVLTDCLMDWNIDTKLSTITLDNCTTNDAMIDKIKDKLHLGSLLRDGFLLHMRCCAHILNLIVKDG